MSDEKPASLEPSDEYAEIPEQKKPYEIQSDVYELTHTIHEDVEAESEFEFDPKKAIIYSEILKRPEY